MKLLCLLCFLCGLQAFALDREAFTFTGYDLDVRIEPEQQRLAVRGKISLRNDSAIPQKNLSLQISSTLAWRSIQIHGERMQFVTQPYTSDIDHTGSLSEAIVSLRQEIAPKASLELEIGYEGTVKLEDTRLTRMGVPPETAKHTDWDQIAAQFTAIRGAGYVVWYPVAMEAASLSDGNSLWDALARWSRREAISNMNVRFDYLLPREQALPILRCNGKSTSPAVSSQESSSHSMACTYSSLSFTVPTFVAGKFEVAENQNIAVDYLSEHKSNAEGYLLAADLARPFVSEWLGAPRQKGEVVDLADPQAAPYESGSMILIPLDKSDARVAQLTAVHQLTHAALFSPRLWIYEGVAHFMQAAYRQQEDGRQAALDFMAIYRSAVAGAEKALTGSRDNPNVAASESLINTSREEFYRSKAMYVWWMLRDLAGEAALKRALAAYRPDQDSEPSYMQRLIEAQAKRDLEWFFDDWVYRDRGLPDFRVDSLYPRALVGGGYLVTVTVENLGDAGAEVPVTLRSEGGEVSRRLEVRGKSKAVLRIESATSPREVVINDGSVPESNLENNTFQVDVKTK